MAGGRGRSFVKEKSDQSAGASDILSRFVSISYEMAVQTSRLALMITKRPSFLARGAHHSRRHLFAFCPLRGGAVRAVMSVATASSTEKAWYEAYPPAQCKNPASITATELLHALKQGKKPGVDFILVDLRRNDHEVRSPIHATLHRD